MDLGFGSDRVGGVAALTTVSIAVAGLITLSPSLGAVVAIALIAAVTLEYFLPVRWATLLPLLLVFLTPADEIVALSLDRRGFFVVGIGTLLFCVTLIRGRVELRRGAQLILPVVAASYLALNAIHWSKGEIRNGMFWIGALGVWTWLQGRRRLDPINTTRTTEDALIIVGAVSGGIGVLEFLRIVEPQVLIPGYEPFQDSFTQEIGRRAVGFSGHALRFGTLCMLGCAFSAARFLNDRTRASRSPLFMLATAFSLGGLIVSGARGSWLALLCGAVVAVTVTTLRSRSKARSVLARTSLAVFGITALVLTSGLGFLVRERLVGSAAAPVSISQRVTAFRAISDSIGQLPLLGVGPGGAAEFLLRGGAVVPNVENEYLIALVTGGPVAMAILLCWAFLVIRSAVRNDVGGASLGTIVAAVAFVLNLATYNLFSWSAGPPLFAVLTSIALSGTAGTGDPGVEVQR